MLVYMLQGYNAGRVLFVSDTFGAKGVTDGWAVDLTNRTYPWVLPLKKSPYAPLPQSYLDWQAAGSPAIDPPTIPVVYKVQQVGSRSEQNLAISGALTTANQKSGGRCRLWISHDCDEIQVGFNGYYTVDAASGNSYQSAETALPNSYDLRCSLEYKGQSKLFQWNGTGSRTVAAGEALALSDKMLASAFGVEKFAKGDQVWLRMERVTPVGGNMLYHYVNVNAPTIDGERYFTGALAATDQLLNTGDWPTTGGWSAQSTVWLPCAFIGKVAGKKMSSAVLGASIEHGATELGGRGDGVNGKGGYIREGFAVNKGARISLMRATESAASFVNNSAKRRVLLQYCTHAYTAHGGNDYSYGLSEASTQTKLSQIWQWCRDAGLKIIHIGLSVKTDSTDSWATEANQTPRAGFEIGGAWRDALHTWANSRVGTDIDKFITFDGTQTAAATGGSRVKWRTDGGQASQDGTHPLDFIHARMAEQMAAEIETDRAAFEIAA